MNTNKFYIMVAEWCPHCRAAKEAIFKLVRNYNKNGNIEILEDTTEKFKIISTKTGSFGIPTFIIVNDKDVTVAKWEGSRDFASLLKFYIKNTETDPLPEDEGFLS